MRKRSLKFKLHPIELEFKGKNVLLVDDSIVRGNTSKKIIELVREAGAKKVYFASSSPPIIGPDPYGIDLPTTTELVAGDRSIEEVRKFIGADGLFYSKIEDMHRAITYGNKEITKFSEGCFTKKYPTPEITPKLLRELGCSRNDSRSDSDDEEDTDGDGTKTMSLV